MWCCGATWRRRRTAPWVSSATSVGSGAGRARRLHAAELEHLGDEPLEPVGFVVHGVEQPCRASVVELRGGGPQGVGRGLDRRQRGAEVVGHRREERGAVLVDRRRQLGVVDGALVRLGGVAHRVEARHHDAAGGRREHERDRGRHVVGAVEEQRTPGRDEPEVERQVRRHHPGDRRRGAEQRGDDDHHEEDRDGDRRGRRRSASRTAVLAPTSADGDGDASQGAHGRSARPIRRCSECAVPAARSAPNESAAPPRDVASHISTCDHDQSSARPWRPTGAGNPRRCTRRSSTVRALFEAEPGRDLTCVDQFLTVGVERHADRVLPVPRGRRPRVHPSRVVTDG